MASVRLQIFDAIEAKLELVRAQLDWTSVQRDPREPIGDDQMNALVLATGGEADPDTLTSGCEICSTDLAVGLMVIEPPGARAEDLLDQGFVAVCNALLDPADIQLGGIAIGILRGGMSAPFVGRGEEGARYIGVQSIDFTVQYMTREGNAELPGP